MPDYLNLARDLLRKAEEEIQDLISKTAGARDYDAAASLAHTARKLTELLECLGDEENLHAPLASKKRLADDFVQREAARRPATPSQKRRGGKSESPRLPAFVRQGEDLVKIGLSRSSDSTYEHRAPKSVIDTVTVRVLSLSQENGKPFTAEALGSMRSDDEPGRVPGYQLYLCLGWLKSLGLIRQHGRKGYSPRDPESLQNAVQRAWEDLPARNQEA